MKTPVLFYLLLLFTIVSCNNAQKNANQKLETEMIAVHDEIMPHMGEFTKYGEEIDSVLNNLSAVKLNKRDLDTLQIRKDLNDLKKSILEANNNMNDWMHKLTLDFDGQTDEEVKTYLETELDAIKKIKVQYDAVMKEKQSLLDPILKQ